MSCTLSSPYGRHCMRTFSVSRFSLCCFGPGPKAALLQAIMWWAACSWAMCGLVCSLHWAWRATPCACSLREISRPTLSMQVTQRHARCVCIVLEIVHHLAAWSDVSGPLSIKGYQVAPAELEALLRQHPAVIDAAVVGRPDLAAGEIPTAYVVRAGEVTDVELMTWVAERVAPHKRIRSVTFLDVIPKIRRRAKRSVDSCAIRESALPRPSGTEAAEPQAPRGCVTLPHVRSRTVRGPLVAPTRGGGFVDSVDREESRRPAVRRTNLVDEFVAQCAQRPATLGDLDEMHVGVEGVKDLEIGRRDIRRRVYPKEIDRERWFYCRVRLGDQAVPGRP